MTDGSFISGEGVKWKETEDIQVGWDGVEKAGPKGAKRSTGMGNQTVLSS